jgi:lysophospholipase L1-like esterase
MQRLLQILFLGCAFLLAVWAQIPTASLAALGLAASALIASEFAARKKVERLEGIWLGLFWGGSLGAWICAALGNLAWNFYYVAPLVLMAGAVWLRALRANRPSWRGRWNAAAMAWWICAVVDWFCAGYFENRRAVFYSGLVAALAVLVLCRLWFRIGVVGAQTVNTIILVLIGLPTADLVLQPQSRLDVRPENCRLYYSYNASHGDPEAFGRWEEYYTSQFDRLGTQIFMPDPDKFLPFRLRPGSRGTFVGCPISINKEGFRGPEISPSKDDAYRIVVLGESTTFGMTIEPEDKPWPELLEQLIHERIKTARPVEVINAGVPAYTIVGNVHRLRSDILPLKPDMMISYHGANGFNLIDPSELPPLGPMPPVYEERPMKLAADVEHRLRMLAFQHQAMRQQKRIVVSRAKSPLKTTYARAYEELIEYARTNGIRLALANFSMAVNQASDSRVIDFYRGGGTRAAYGFIRANTVHSIIVGELAAQNPAVCLVDTHPHLDGDHEKFIDLIHFSSEGERQMAENIFAGISNVLQQDLCSRATMEKPASTGAKP